MKRMDLDLFLKLVKRLNPCKDGIERFEKMSGSLRDRLVAMHESEYMSVGYSDLRWLVDAIRCPNKKCGSLSCGRLTRAPKKRLRAYLVRIGVFTL